MSKSREYGNLILYGHSFSRIMLHTACLSDKNGVMKHTILLIVAFIVILGLGFLYRIIQRYDSSMQGLNRATKGMSNISLQLRGVTMASVDRGRILWSLNADDVTLFRQGGGDLDQVRTITFSPIHNGKFYQDGKLRAVFSAQNATYDQLTQSFDIRGKIRLRGAEQERLDSDECIWSEREDYIRFPQGASAAVGKNTLQTNFLVYSPSSRMLQCPQGASGFLNGYQLQAAALYWNVRNGDIQMPSGVNGSKGNLLFNASSMQMNLAAHTWKANNGVVQLRIENETSAGVGL
jgi:hypothetical protein